jgi:hypothetical protein
MSKELIEQLANPVFGNHPAGNGRRIIGFIVDADLASILPLGDVSGTFKKLLEAYAQTQGQSELLEKAAKYDAINTPEIHDFMKAVENEALHQRDRWGADHDAGKTDADWFWLIGYLAGKAMNKPEKALHHIITTAAACLNWHAAKIGAHNKMRPGIDAAPIESGVKDVE